MVYDDVDDRREVVQQHFRTLHLVENLNYEQVDTMIPR